MAMNILIIDDELVVREAIEFALDGLGYGIRTASGGREGVKMAAESPPDLIFLDLNMPEMDGIDTLRALKQVVPESPVYIITAFQKEFLGRLQAAVRDGLEYDLAQKPLNSSQNLQIVESYQPEA
ncbi:MAG: response regulator [gamma proteobacterium symbiont of Phacoides pectinatus]